MDIYAEQLNWRILHFFLDIHLELSRFGTDNITVNLGYSMRLLLHLIPKNSVH